MLLSESAILVLLFDLKQAVHRPRIAVSDSRVNNYFVNLSWDLKPTTIICLLSCVINLPVLPG